MVEDHAGLNNGRFKIIVTQELIIAHARGHYAAVPHYPMDLTDFEEGQQTLSQFRAALETILSHSRSRYK